MCADICTCCREEGFLALWRGWLPSVIGVVPYVGLNFGVYETLKDVIIKTWGEGRPGERGRSEG
jgi:solute carrier family 25 phosphate transporter 23/24/25/41